MQLTALSSTSFGQLTAKDIRRMQADGLIDEDDNFELIEGRIVPMGPKYHAHERLKSELGMALARVCPQDLIVGFETSLFLGADTIVEPDLCVYSRSLRSEDVRGGDVLLAIEIASSTLAQDRGPKARLYAGYNVRELWVIDTNTRTTWIQRNAAAGQWQEIVELRSSETLRFDAIPALAVRLDQFN
jgi:Uma2 family endonuclease